MITRALSPLSLRILAVLVVSLFIAGVAAVAAAGDTMFQVQLIWGTNGEKPKNKPLKDVDPKQQEKFKGIFKWANYYEVNSQPLTLAKESTQKLKLSEKCEIEVQDLGTSRVEIRLFGEGKLVVKRAQSIIPGEMIVVGGPSKNDTAWFVALTPQK